MGWLGLQISKSASSFLGGARRLCSTASLLQVGQHPSCWMALIHIRAFCLHARVKPSHPCRCESMSEPSEGYKTAALGANPLCRVLRRDVAVVVFIDSPFLAICATPGRRPLQRWCPLLARLPRANRFRAEPPFSNRFIARMIDFAHGCAHPTTWMALFDAATPPPPTR